MSQEQPIEQFEPVETSQEPQSATIVITLPKRVKMALVSVWEFICSLFTGEVIINRSVSKGYQFLLGIAVVFLVSIWMLFFSLHRQIHENRLRTEVKLLSEKALRYREQLIRQTTHSAILNEANRRGMELYDPEEQITVIKKK